MQEYRLLIDLHKRAKRQGPGGDTQTRMAVDLAGIDRSAPLRIADIGCGTGSSALLLASLLDARITAVDFLPEFLELLEAKADRSRLSERISTLNCDMGRLPFGEGAFDVIWSEGAIYSIGFEKGVRKWKRFLKTGGLLVVSEITWLTASRPAEIEDYWQNEYPQIDTASAKIRILEKHGYSPLAWFVLPEHCWLENYYRPLQEGFDGFLERNGNSESAKAIVDAEKKEIALYEKFKAYYSYGVYIAKKGC